MELTEAALERFLKYTNITDDYINVLLEKKDTYKICFTAPSQDATQNYELFEFLGDSTINEAIIWYFYYLFPQLHCPGGVKTLSRLKINNSSTESFSAFAETLGFLPYINAAKEELEEPNIRAKIMEDVFEAFIGVTKLVLAEKFGYLGVGNQIVYNMIKTLLDQRTFVLDPNELYDTKTRLKELFDRKDVQNRYGLLKYGYEGRPKYVEIFFKQGGVMSKISQGEGLTKVVQEKDAAAKALKFLESQGYNTEKKFKLLCDV